MAEEQFTPVARCKFPWLNKPDTRWKKEDGEYKVNLVFGPEDEFIAQIEADAKAAYEEAKVEWDEKVAAMAPRARAKAGELEYYDPIVEEMDAEGEPTGNLMLCFKTSGMITDRKTKQKRPVKLNCADSFGRPVKKIPNVGSGSELVVKFKPKSNVIKGTHYYNLYLNAFQIVKLVEFEGGDAGFKNHGAKDGFDGSGLDDEDTGTEDVDESEF